MTPKKYKTTGKPTEIVCVSGSSANTQTHQFISPVKRILSLASSPVFHQKEGERWRGRDGGGEEEIVAPLLTRCSSAHEAAGLIHSWSNAINTQHSSQRCPQLADR